MESGILETVAERWNTHAEKYDTTHHGNNTEEDISNWKEVLEAQMGDDRRVEVLDVGAGTGFLTLLISELGYRCRGLDISGGMLDVARQHARERGLAIEFIQGAVESMPISDNSLDVIANRSLMWTLLTPDTILKEWLRALKPGGKLLCFCTAGKGMPEGHHYSQEIEDMLPLKGASVEKLTSVLSEAGFIDVEAVHLEKIRNAHDDEKTWYAIKGKKCIY